MKGVLLINMGGPLSLRELKQFLTNMFMDPCILPLIKPLRYLLSKIISNARYKKSWEKYKMIGGTPIISSTEKIAKRLGNRLNSQYSVRTAFSYSSPLIRDSMLAFKNEGIKEITVVPLYPHPGYSTTSSVKADVNKFVSGNKDLHVVIIKEFYRHDGFIRFWSEIISQHILERQYTHPFLLFSAHSIPFSFVLKGDVYPEAVKESAKMIAGNIGIEYDLAYQSGMQNGEWLNPDSKQKLKELAALGISEIVMVPISFVSENLETLYDLDCDIIPYSVSELGIKAVSRVNIPEAHDLFIRLLADLVNN